MFSWDIPFLLTSYKPPSSPYILLTGRKNNVTWTPALRFKYAVSKLWNLSDRLKENAATLLLLCGWPFPPNWAMASIVCSFCSSVLLFGNFLVSLFRMFLSKKKWATLLLCYRQCWPNWTTASTFSPLPTAHSWCKAEANSRWHPARPPTTSLVAPPLPPTRGGGVGCHWWRSRLKVSSTLALTFQDKLGKLVSTLI